MHNLTVSQGQPPLLPIEKASTQQATLNPTSLADTDNWQNSKAALLDCMAEAISSSRGWAMVTVTALRESEEQVLIDVVTNAGWDYSELDDKMGYGYLTEDRGYFDEVQAFMDAVGESRVWKGFGLEAYADWIGSS